jgi:hypothetical protein
MISGLEEDVFNLHKSVRNIKTKLFQVEIRLEKLAKVMVENGENSKLLWKLLEEMPTHISKFGEDRIIKDVKSNLKQLRDDRSALLKGNIQELYQQRNEMSLLIQNYNRLQKDEASIMRDVQNINSQIETLTNLGRSHAQALARHYTPSNLFGPFDICSQISNYDKTLSRLQDNILPSEKKKKKIVQFKTEVHSNLCKWNYVPDNEKDIKKHLMRKKLQGGSKKQYTEFEEKQQKEIDERQPYSSCLEFAEMCEYLVMDTADVEKEIIDLSLAIIDRTKQKTKKKRV